MKIELGDIGPYGKGDLHFVLVLLIVLRQPFSHFAGGDSDDRIGAGVIVGRSVKNGMAEGTFLQLIQFATNGALDNFPEKTGISLAVAEVWTLQEEIQMLS